MAKEKQVIDFDPTERRRSSLPGAGEGAVDTDIQEFREEVEAQATNGEENSTERAPVEPDGGSEVINDDA